MIPAILVTVYLTVFVCLTAVQRKLIYHPCRESLVTLETRAAATEFQAWHNVVGEHIGWKRLSKTQPAVAQFLILHGNTGCALDWNHYADAVQSLCGVDVYLLEYPGYGSRLGALCQDGFFRAAAEAVAELSREQRTYVIGESLGTGVATYLAASMPQKISGVLLVAPYNNMGAVAQHHLKVFPARWMLRDKFASDIYLRRYSGPVGFLLADRDEVVPNQFGRRLYDGYSGPKRLWVAPNAGHDDLHRPAIDWWKQALNFLDITISQAEHADKAT